MNRNSAIDDYLEMGCGRCKLGGTPACKVHSWPEELKLLRKIVLDCGLTEERKWSVPCYTFQKRNILILAAFKHYCALNFFKGSLLNDPEKKLTSPGENSQAVRGLRFTDVQSIVALEHRIKAYIFEAIELEKAGSKISSESKPTLEYPEEFQIKLNKNKALKEAFEALTPGRQRAYLIHFSQAKQSKTRQTRIEKYIPVILAGKGMMD